VTTQLAGYISNVFFVFDNQTQYQHTKHIEMDIHFVRENVARDQAHVLHIPSMVGIFTKGLPFQLFVDFRDSLNIR